MLNGRAMKVASRSIETNCRRAARIFFLISKKKKKNEFARAARFLSNCQGDWESCGC